MMEDQDEHPLHKFVARVDNMPHIHEEILDQLNMYDMANCLKASKDLRKFVISGIKNNTYIQDDLDEAVSRTATTTDMIGPLDKKEYPSLKKEGKLSILQESRFGFGFDNSFWLQIESSSKPEFKGENVLNVYDMPSGSLASIIPADVKHMYQHRPNVKLLSKSRVLLEDKDKIRIAARAEDKKSYKVVYESQPLGLSRCIQYNRERDEAFFADDCIYSYTCSQSCVRLGDSLPPASPWRFTFFRHLDDTRMVSSTIRIPDKPDNILKKV